MWKWLQILPVFGLLAVAGCNQKKAEQSEALPFPQVKVPSIYLEDEEGAVKYVSMHFWDGLTDTSRHYRSDSLYVSGVKRDEVEQHFADYAGLLGAVPYPVSKAAMENMYDRMSVCEEADTSSNVFETLVEFAEKYLYDPNSPLRNEDIYLPLVERLASWHGWSEEQRSLYAFRAGKCSMNMVGTKAADFVFSDKNGRIRSLYDIKAEFTVLFFSNPGCEACKHIIRTLTSSEVINRMVADGTLAVANIYIDEDIAAWYDYMPIYPEEWFNGYDPNLVIRGDSIYDVRAIPSLYLLDKDKNVILKDAPEERFFSWLENNVLTQDY